MNKTIHVDAYTRSDGTEVRSHFRSSPSIGPHTVFIPQTSNTPRTIFLPENNTEQDKSVVNFPSLLDKIKEKSIAGYFLHNNKKPQPNTQNKKSKKEIAAHLSPDIIFSALSNVWERVVDTLGNLGDVVGEIDVGWAKRFHFAHQINIYQIMK